MTLLQASELSFQHAGQSQPLIQKAAFSIEPGDRIGLVGPNGTGKSTLLRLLAGEWPPTSGAVIWRSGVRLACVAQEKSSSDVMLEHHLMANCDGQAEPVIRVIAGLGLDPDALERPLSSLSGGERARAEVARVLLHPADVLFLDEPTNYLDGAGRRYLKHFLRHLDVPFVMVSHDREFLSSAVNRIFELERGQLSVYTGNWSAYVQEKSRRHQQAWAQFEGQQRRWEAEARASEQRAALARQVATPPPGQNVRSGKDFYRAKAAKIDRTARVLRERQLRDRPLDRPFEETAIPTLDFSGVRRSGDVVLRMEGLAHGFGDRTLFGPLDVVVMRGERLAIMGDNGSGKTTLLRCLIGEWVPRCGNVIWGHHVQWGYLSQELELLDLDRNPVAVGLSVCADERWVRTLLGCLKIKGEKAERPLGQLSVGERVKTAIARLVLAGSNVLILDEPTDHLDLEARLALEATLNQFPGTVILVSHDPEFVRALATRTLILDKSDQ